MGKNTKQLSKQDGRNVVHVGHCNLSDAEYIRIGERSVVVLGID